MEKNVLDTIRHELTSAATPEAKASALKFVPGAQKVYGVKMPVINELAKKYKVEGFPLVHALWKSGAYEERILAAKITGHLAKKSPQEALAAVKEFSEQLNDWATCDTLGMQSLKPIAQGYRSEICSLARTLNLSDDPWQRRLSLVLVEVYTKEKPIHPQIESLIRPLENDPHPYVKKAVAWLRRNMNDA